MGQLDAVLLGDYLFSNAFYLASTTDCAKACRMIGNSTNQVCEGELQQLYFEQDFELPESQYLEIILGKTGRLISCATELSTLFQSPAQDSEKDDPALANSMRRFGETLGIAFQIHDDILDLLGSSNKTGKTLGTDLRNQKATLPLIRALKKLTGNDREAFIATLRTPNSENICQAVATMESLGAIDESRCVASEYAQQALACLSDLPQNEYRTALEELVEFAVDRTF